MGVMEMPIGRLVMLAEVGAESPLWDASGDMVSLETLPLSVDLRAALTRWADVGWEGDDDQLHDEGRRLHLQVVDAVRPIEVVWDND